MKSRRPAPIAVLAAAVVVLASLAAAPAGASPDPLGTVLAWIVQPLCGRPAPGNASCDAVELVHRRVARGELGADAATEAQPAALPAASRGPAGGFSPAGIATAYGIDAGSSAGSGQVVAIVDACIDPRIAADLNTFDAKYGLPAETASSFRQLSMTGTTKDACTSDDRYGWAGETSLDVQAVRGTCHRCKILLVEAADASHPHLAAAVDAAAGYRWSSGGHTYRVTEISNSYGTPENNPALPSGYAGHYLHRGIAVIASTGDDGWYSWDRINNSDPRNPPPDGVAQVPAALSTVVAVGGTTLTVNADGTRHSETVWNRNGPSDDDGATAGSALGASGGGCSIRYDAKRWQYGVAHYADLGCGSVRRNSTDIAADADPATGYDVYLSYANLLEGGRLGWQTIGGTSLAAPLIAGMWAASGGPAGVTYPAMTLYGHFKGEPSTLYDVRSGANAMCGTASRTACASAWGQPNDLGFGALDCGFDWLGHRVTGSYQCHARAGYDGPSGVGSPLSYRTFRPLFPAAAIARPAHPVHGVRATFNGGYSTDPFPNGTVTSYHWQFGDGHVLTTSATTASHVYAKPGTYRVYLTVSDVYGRTSITKSLPLVVR